ncbi:MAG: hypothetical protein EHM71_06105 [Zetaproteobacteria bacterium]|nr:MAG: hypothetical protein EHM71_06105 [Zetaproteobacteria bacterium]
MQERDEIPVRVECYSGYRAEEYPIAFWLREHRVAVREILDRWLGDDHAYFKIAGDDGTRYLLRRDDRRDRWELIPMAGSAAQSMEARD